MNNYREVELLASKTIGDSGTETIDINVDEPITELSIRFGLTNGTEVAEEVPPEIAVTKIEIVDGGRVYYSINGYEASAIAWYEKGIWPCAWYDATASYGQNIEWPLQFGRFVGDPQYAFSPGRLLNPQLKITWAKNTLHLTNVCTLAVNAKTMQGVPAPSLALLTKNIRSWTTAAAGIEEVDLPTDHPYRRLYFRAFAVDAWLGAAWSNFKLECDVGKLIVFEMDDEELMNLMCRTWGETNYSEFIKASNGIIHQTHLGFCHDAHYTSMENYVWVTGSPTRPGYVRSYAVNFSEAPQTDVRAAARYFGYAPENTYCYPFGLQDDPASWFDVRKYGSVKLKITEGTASLAASVLVQQPVPLP